MEKLRLRLPLQAHEAEKLRAGDEVLLTGSLLTGRDAAHQRLDALLRAGKPLPIDIQDATIYYVGPAPARPGHAVGPAGPTSSYRMDVYTPQLLDRGLRGIIGKGARSPAVIDALVRNGAVYFAAIGGAAALLAKSIAKAEVVCYEDLGTEAIHRFEVVDFPVIVAVDCTGGNLYESGARQFCTEAE